MYFCVFKKLFTVFKSDLETFSMNAKEMNKELRVADSDDDFMAQETHRLARILEQENREKEEDAKAEEVPDLYTKFLCKDAPVGASADARTPSNLIACAKKIGNFEEVSPEEVCTARATVECGAVPIPG